jgi:putative peptidoglycan binding protein
MKHPRHLAVASVIFAAWIAPASTHADEHWWWRHHHERVIVEPEIDVRVYRETYYTKHHRSLEADVQVALSRRGYYRGPIDGDIGPGSRGAIAAYQRDHGLAVTGNINSALIRSLGI